MVMRVYHYLVGALLESSLLLLREYWKREGKVGEREKLAKQEIKAVPFTDTEVFPLFDLSQNRSLKQRRRTKL